MVLYSYQHFSKMMFFADYFSVLLKSFSLYNDMWCFRFRLGFYLIKIFHCNFFSFRTKDELFPKSMIYMHIICLCLCVHTYMLNNDHRLTSWLVHLIDSLFFSNVAWSIALWMIRLIFVICLFCLFVDLLFIKLHLSLITNFFISSSFPFFSLKTFSNRESLQQNKTNKIQTKTKHCT